MDRLRVLNPPVDTILKAWFTASNGDIPASTRLIPVRREIPTYTETITYTVLIER